MNQLSLKPTLQTIKTHMGRLRPRSFISETRAELLKSIRSLEFVIPTTTLPVFFYLVILMLMKQHTENSTYMLATFGIFTAMGPALFGFGINISIERERGWFDVKRASPLVGTTYIVAKLAVTLMFTCVALFLVYVVAGILGEVRLSVGVWTLLFLSHCLCVVPFSLIGIGLGFSLRSNAAIAICNVVFLGLAMLGGLWFPVFLFPDLMKSFAFLLPSYHLAEISLYTVGLSNPDSPFWVNLIVVLCMTAALLGLALTAWRRQLD